MSSMKKVSIGVLSTALAFTMTACGSSTETSSTSKSSEKPAAETKAPTTDKKVTIEYWHTYSDAEEKLLVEEIKPLFEKENPGIELKLTRMPYENLKQQVITSVSGDAAPDLMRMDIVWVPEFANMGALLEVSKMDGYKEMKPNLFETPVATTYLKTKKGEGYYGLPVNTNTKVAIYNKAILNEIGKKEVPKTMQELEEYAKAAKAKGKKGSITIGGNYPWAMIPYFYSLGGKFTSDDYTKVEGVLNGPESVKALETIVRWNKEGLISPPILGGEPGTWDGMKNNDYMMIDDGPWFYSLLMAEKDSKFKPLEDTVRGLIPAGDGGGKSVVGGEDLVIFASSKHPKEAWTFAKWMLGEAPQKIMAKVGLIPTNKKAAADPKVMETPFIKEFVEQMKTTVARTPIPQFGEMDSIISLAFEKSIRGEMKPQDALNEAAKQIEAVLKK
ncbi:carbohydrate ABC transporter substrate-binding protein, CUT1 family [Paenibacillus sp. yr247]|uniref:extracellular solute-binding protein n=1 Tax=Paenibacillus sp. yr247 TaxID=1761880 RepID=UPI000882B820|nr:extracellular solute-binding protein [Paenibacillus sp. yr247]SDM82857.1 carbohydrate ABC transporter substrate-binding protein, CUT1 family [Paenibacillus sp. yr247]